MKNMTLLHTLTKAMLAVAFVGAAALTTGCATTTSSSTDTTDTAHHQKMENYLDRRDGVAQVKSGQ